MVRREGGREGGREEQYGQVGCVFEHDSPLPPSLLFLPPYRPG